MKLFKRKRWKNDFIYCPGTGDLEKVLRTIDKHGYQLLTVTQHEHVYTVFYRRPIDG